MTLEVMLLLTWKAERRMMQGIIIMLKLPVFFDYAVLLHHLNLRSEEQPPFHSTIWYTFKSYFLLKP